MNDTAQNQELEKKNAQLEAENAQLKRLASKKEIGILLLHFAAVAVASLPLKVGIEKYAEILFKKDNVFKAKIIAYSVIGLVIFPLIGCVVSSCYENMQEAKSNTPINTETNKVKAKNGNFIKNWYQDFTSPENFKKNLTYYPIVGFVNSFLCLAQIIIYKGIDEIFKDTENHKIEIKVAANLVAVVCIVIIATIFSIALKNLLWQNAKVPSSEFNVTDAMVQTNDKTIG